MGLVESVENYLGILLFIALAIGLFFPFQTSFLESYAVPFISVAIFFGFLKVDFSKVFGYVKRPLLLAYVLLVFLVVIPSAVFLLASLADPITAVGLLLVFGVPTGATSVVIVDLLKGNVHMALVLQFFMYMLAPFTLPFLSFYLAGSVISVDAFGLFMTMVQMLLIPLVASQLVKRAVNTKPAEGYTSLITITMIALTGMGVLGKNSAFVFSNMHAVVSTMAMLYVLYAVMGLVGYCMVFWLGREERKTVGISKAFMNGTLALVLASQFFGPEIILVTLANFIVWFIVLGSAKHFLK